MSSSVAGADGTESRESRPEAGDGTVAVRDAASVVLLRDGAEGLETFMLTRAPSMVFSAGATVFPGGGVDPADRLADALPESFWSATDLESWADDVGGGVPLARALLTAAVRETFEECGVLLARPAGDGASSAGLTVSRPSGRVLQDELRRDRRAVESREMTLPELLARHDLRPDFPALRPLSRWITPPGHPRRYDTRFFAAALPPGQHAVHATDEAVSAFWVTPRQAFAAFRQGRTDLMAPTWSQLYTLSGFSCVEEVLRAPIAPLEMSPAEVPPAERGPLERSSAGAVTTRTERVDFPGRTAYEADLTAREGESPSSLP